MTNSTNENEGTYEAEVLESAVIDDGIFRALLLRAGRSIALPTLEAMELVMDINTPPQVKASMIAALTYLLMPLDLIPDFIPVGGFSDDLVALTAVISIWRGYITTDIRKRALKKLDEWFPSLS